MSGSVRYLLVVIAVIAGAHRGFGHYHLFLPRSPAGEQEKAMSFTIAWGHPFEHQFEDVARPERLRVIAPDGTTTDLTESLKPVQFKGGEGGKAVGSFSFDYMPARRGDHVFTLKAAPVWSPAEKWFYHDTARVILHVLTQNGWDHASGGPLELVPQTRPYGLEPGLAFQVQALSTGKPVGGALVEVERYNPVPPKESELPPDEHITRRAKTDPNGIATCTLTDPGWWAITVVTDGGMREHDGKNYPVKRRSTLWVHVDPKWKPPTKP